MQGLAKEPVVLEPGTKWHVVYEEDNCRLARAFGEGESRVILSFDQTSPVSKLRPTISGPPVKALIGPRTGVSAAFGEKEKLVPVGALPGTTGADKQPMLVLNPLDLLNRQSNEDMSAAAPPTPSQLNSIENFTLARGGKVLVLHIGPLSKALATLGTCTSDLVKLWGLDPDQQATLRSRPVPSQNPAGWLRSDDYPGSALRGGRSATIAFRLMVDATGTPSACKIQTAISSPEFIEHTCKLLIRRARFTPARDAAGAPSPSYYVNSVNWVMPGL